MMMKGDGHIGRLSGVSPPSTGASCSGVVLTGWAGLHKRRRRESGREPSAERHRNAR